MNYDDVIRHFGSQVQAAAALELTQPTISMWRARGSIPKLQQLRIEYVTDGKLQADASILGPRPKPRGRKVSRA